MPLAWMVVSSRPSAMCQSCSRFAQNSGPTQVLFRSAGQPVWNAVPAGWQPDSIRHKYPAKNRQKRKGRDVNFITLACWVRSYNLSNQKRNFRLLRQELKKPADLNELQALERNECKTTTNSNKAQWREDWIVRSKPRQPPFVFQHTGMEQRHKGGHISIPQATPPACGGCC